MYWSVWSDRAGAHAEAIVGAARWGFVHVTCAASTQRELEQQRSVAEQLLH
jgi:hypothetical protein